MNEASNGNGNNYLNTVVTEELFQELQELEGQRLVGVALWEQSLADDQDAPDPEQQIYVDLDLYLEDGIQMELYESALFASLDADPVLGLEAIAARLAQAIEAGLWLEEVAVDDEELLVLILAHSHQPVLYLSVGGWSASEWDELPEDEDEA